MLLTRSPLNLQVSSVRLACIRHAASVHPEPGSNSPFDIDSTSFLWGFRLRFQSVSPGYGQVIYVLLTRSPLNLQVRSVRLACIRHAASVHPEPGSNSPFDIDSNAYAF